jgi:hypothetical protein
MNTERDDLNINEEDDDEDDPFSKLILQKFYPI